MSQRHPNVANISEVQPISMEKGSRFGFQARPLGMATGGRGIGCSYYEQQPGKTAFPAHFHTANEEAMYVLEGKASVRIGKDWVEVGPGDYVTFPVGPDSCHQVVNKSDSVLRYLCLSTMKSVDIVAYPDSKKIGVRAQAPGSNRMDPTWIRFLWEEGTAVDYYHGEKVDHDD